MNSKGTDAMLGIHCDNLKLIKSFNLSLSIIQTMLNKANIIGSKKPKLPSSFRKYNANPKAKAPKDNIANIYVITIKNIELDALSSFLSIISSYVSFVFFGSLTGTTFP